MNIDFAQINYLAVMIGVIINMVAGALGNARQRIGSKELEQ